MKPMGTRRGFTLVEMMVVITILVILAGILFPVFVHARSKATEISCVARIRQVGIAVRQYALDHDGAYPPMVQERQGRPWRWVNLVYAYAPDPDVFVCPGNPVRLDEASRPDPTAFLPETSYYYCGVSVGGRTEQDFDDVGRTIILMDGWYIPGEGGLGGLNWEMFDSSGIGATDLAAWVCDVPTDRVGTRELQVMHRHGGGVVACYMDGHCERIDYAAPQQFLVSSR